MTYIPDPTELYPTDKPYRIYKPSYDPLDELFDEEERKEARDE